MVAARVQEGLEELFHIKVRRGGGEEIPLVQDKNSCEEIPHVQGKRNPSKTAGVARGHQRTDTLKPLSQKLVNLITLRPQPCLTQ